MIIFKQLYYLEYLLNNVTLIIAPIYLPKIMISRTHAYYFCVLCFELEIWVICSLCFICQRVCNYQIQFNMDQHIIPNTTATQTGIQQQATSSLLSPILIVIVVLILIAAALKLKKSKKKPKSIIAIIGERFAGKTQLFINMNEGKKMRTVPSIHNNRTAYKLGSKTYEIVDYIGDNISKEQVLQQVDQIYAVIHVVDGTDEKTISDAAMFIYKMLVNKQYQRNNCNYIIFLNKSEQTGYLGRVKIEQKLEDQIQHIKQSRISQGEENQSEDDYIKLSKNRFKIPFKIIEGSAESNIKDLQMTLENF